MWDNPYYNPEKLGLRILESVDEGGDWEFDLFVIWEDTDPKREFGMAYWGEDSGCSCPTPFESVRREDLHYGRLHEAYDALAEWQDARARRGY